MIDNNSGDVGWAESGQKDDQNSVAKLVVLIRIEEEVDQHRGDTEARNIWDKMKLAKWTEEGRARRQNGKKYIKNGLKFLYGKQQKIQKLI